MNISSLFTPRSLPGLFGRVMLTMAALVALYLASISLSQTTVAGCDDSSGCHAVLSSRWAYIFGLPASFPAIAIYLVAVLAAGAFEARDTRTWLGMGGQVAILLITVGSVWYLYLQFIMLGQFCPWCCLAHFLGLGGVFFLTWSRRLHPRENQLDPAWSQARVLQSNGLMGFARIGAVGGGLVALAAGPFINSNQRSADGIQTESAIELAKGARGASTLSLQNGRIHLNTGDLPLIGEKKASEFAVALVDYTCEHCRNYHATLEEVVRQRGGNLAIVLVPAARDDEAVQVQQAMLCLYRADRAKHNVLATQLLSGTQPATGAAVRLSARGLLGDEAWAQAQASFTAWATGQIEIAGAIREGNRDSIGSGRLPQLMAGNEILVGYHEDAVKVSSFIDRGLHPATTKENVLAEAGLKQGPVISLKRPMTDIGRIEAATKTACKIELQNTGKSPLKLEWVALDQGCELVSLPDQEILPGAEGTLHLMVTANPGELSFQRRVTIHSNASQPSTAMIQGLVTGATAQAAVATPLPR